MAFLSWRQRCRVVALIYLLSRFSVEHAAWRYGSLRASYRYTNLRGGELWTGSGSANFLSCLRVLELICSFILIFASIARSLTEMAFYFHIHTKAQPVRFASRKSSTAPTPTHGMSKSGRNKTYGGEHVERSRWVGDLDRAGMHAWENALIVDLDLEADWAGLGGYSTSIR